MICTLALTSPDPKRLITVVVENKMLFESLCKYKDITSLKVNMSLILMNDKDFIVEREEVISLFDNDKKNLISIT